MKTILLLEDEIPLLGLLSRFLGRRGFSVLKAAFPEDAIRQFMVAERRIDLFIADNNLPTVSGVQVALLLRQELPELPVILTSGYPVDGWSASDAADLDRLGRDSVRVLVKPFTSESLLQAIDSATITPGGGELRMSGG